MIMISFSGLDSSGKGTQIAVTEKHLNEQGIKCRTLWARGSWTPGIELIKRIVRRDKGLTDKQKEQYRRKVRSNPWIQRLILILSILDLIWYWGLFYRLAGLFVSVLICDRYIWDTLVDFRVN